MRQRSEWSPPRFSSSRARRRNDEARMTKSGDTFCAWLLAPRRSGLKPRNCTWSFRRFDERQEWITEQRCSRCSRVCSFELRHSFVIRHSSFVILPVRHSCFVIPFIRGYFADTWKCLKKSASSDEVNFTSVSGVAFNASSIPSTRSYSSPSSISAGSAKFRGVMRIRQCRSQNTRTLSPGSKRTSNGCKICNCTAYLPRTFLTSAAAAVFSCSFASSLDIAVWVSIWNGFHFSPSCSIFFGSSAKPGK